FPIERVILVADRGLLSLDNIGALTSLAEQGGRTLEFILAVPARRYSDLVETFRDMAFDENGLTEGRFAGHRLIVAHDPFRRSSTKLVYICGLSALLIESSQWVNDIQGPKFCSHTPTAVSVCLDGSA